MNTKLESVVIKFELSIRIRYLSCHAMRHSKEILRDDLYRFDRNVENSFYVSHNTKKNVF